MSSPPGDQHIHDPGGWARPGVSGVRKGVPAQLITPDGGEKQLAGRSCWPDPGLPQVRAAACLGSGAWPREVGGTCRWWTVGGRGRVRGRADGRVLATRLRQRGHMARHRPPAQRVSRHLCSRLADRSAALSCSGPARPPAPSLLQPPCPVRVRPTAALPAALHGTPLPSGHTQASNTAGLGPPSLPETPMPSWPGPWVCS